MRSVVVVFPASMWAMMPMFRTLSSAYVRAIFVVSATFLVPEVAESLVAFSHLVRLFAALDGGADPVGGVHQFPGEFLLHTLPRWGPGVTYDPPPGQRRPAVGPDFHRHLVGRAADPAGLDLQHRGGVLQGRIEDLDGVLLGHLPDPVQGAVDDPLGRAPLAPLHDDVDELSYALVCVHWVRQGDTLVNSWTPRHLGLLRLLALGAILRAALLASLGAGRVEGAADDVVPDTREVLDAAAADQDHRVLLEGVADPGDVGGHLLAGGKTHPGPLPKRRVGFLRGRRVDAHADPPPLRGALQRRCFRLLHQRLAAVSDQL